MTMCCLVKINVNRIRQHISALLTVFRCSYSGAPIKAWPHHGVLHLYSFCERRQYPAVVKQFHAEISGAHVVQ